MNTLKELARDDRSWEKAQQLVERHFDSASLIWRLVRSGWASSFDEKEFIKLFTFSHLNPTCLTRAAQEPQSETFSLEQLAHTVQNLGVPMASVVVAVNFSCSKTLSDLSSISEGKLLWKTVFSELMTFVEIGSRFGIRVRELGAAAGALAGFGVGCGMLVALVENPRELKLWLSKAPPMPSSIETLGAELSQISGFLLQHLGFGHEAATGAAFGSGLNNLSPLVFTPDTTVWISACRWIESLRYSRNYPREATLRAVFPSITPPAVGSGVRNNILEALYADVAGVVRDGSKWTWHLPRGSYEETEKLLNF